MSGVEGIAREGLVLRLVVDEAENGHRHGYKRGHEHTESYDHFILSAINLGAQGFLDVIDLRVERPDLGIQCIDPPVQADDIVNG